MWITVLGVSEHPWTFSVPSLLTVASSCIRNTYHYKCQFQHHCDCFFIHVSFNQLEVISQQKMCTRARVCCCFSVSTTAVVVRDFYLDGSNNFQCSEWRRSLEVVKWLQYSNDQGHQSVNTFSIECWSQEEATERSCECNQMNSKWQRRYSHCSTTELLCLYNSI